MFAFDPIVMQNHHNIDLAVDDSPESPSLLDNEAEFFRLVDDYGKSIQSPAPKVKGSLFIKRYNSLIAGALYAYTHHQYGLNLSLSNIRIVLEGSGIKFRIQESDEFHLLQQPHPLEQRRELYFRHLYSDNVCRVFERVVRHTGIQESNLWATLSYMLAYWKEEWIYQAQSPQLKAQIEENYRYMTKEANPLWFGEKVENPLIHRFRKVKIPMHGDRHILLREKCCLNYCLPGGDRYCYTCPLITDERRIEKYLAAH